MSAAFLSWKSTASAPPPPVLLWLVQHRPARNAEGNGETGTASFTVHVSAPEEGAA